MGSGGEQPGMFVERVHCSMFNVDVDVCVPLYSQESMMISTTPSLEVATLGRFEVRRNSYPLSGGNWSRRKVVDLFKLLLSAERHRFHREQIQEILWPTSSSEQAANSFGKTVAKTRYYPNITHVGARTS